MAYIGSTVRITANFRDWDGTLVDPSTMTLRIYDKNRRQIGSSISITASHKVVTGSYKYEYTIPEGVTSEVIYEWKGILATGYAVIGRGRIPVRWV